MKWFVVEDDSDKARSLISRVDLMAPGLIHVEVANAIWKKQRRGELARTPELLELAEPLSRLLQTIDERSVLGRALEIALDLDHAVYDCIYLAMAEQLGAELLTADLKFFRKAHAHGFAATVRAL